MITKHGLKTVLIKKKDCFKNKLFILFQLCKFTLTTYSSLFIQYCCDIGRIYINLSSIQHMGHIELLLENWNNTGEFASF